MGSVPSKPSIPPQELKLGKQLGTLFVYNEDPSNPDFLEFVDGRGGRVCSGLSPVSGRREHTVEAPPKEYRSPFSALKTDFASGKARSILLSGDAPVTLRYGSRGKLMQCLKDANAISPRTMGLLQKELDRREQKQKEGEEKFPTK